MFIRGLIQLHVLDWRQFYFSHWNIRKRIIEHCSVLIYLINRSSFVPVLNLSDSNYDIPDDTTTHSVCYSDHEGEIDINIILTILLSFQLAVLMPWTGGREV